MEAPKEIRTMQFRIFEQHVLPFGALMSAFGRDALRKVFGFSHVDESNVPELYFSNGIINLEEGAQAVAIPSVHINDRRIIIEVIGSTSDANAVFDTILQAVMSLHRAPPDNVTPLVLTHESTCTVELPFSWERLLPDQLVEFVKSDVCKAASVGSTLAQTLSGGVGIRLVFSSPDPKLQGTGITLADKQLVIEPKLGSAPADRLYFVRAPTDTETLLRLLSKLTKVLK